LALVVEVKLFDREEIKKKLLGNGHQGQEEGQLLLGI